MLKPIGFWSYSSSDDEHSRGRLSQLRALLAAELQQKIGRSLKVNIFQDVAAIPPGTEWEKQIRDAINGSFFLIPIVTPALLQSEWCCQEITLFRQREATTLRRKDLILPLHYISVDDLDASRPEDCHDPEVFNFLRSRQWIDFRRQRLKNTESEDVALRVEAMADAICSALRRPGGNLDEEEARKKSAEARARADQERERTRQAAATAAERQRQEGDATATREAKEKAREEERRKNEADEKRRRASGAIPVEVGSPGRNEIRYFVPGDGQREWFVDHPAGPEMVVVPAGSFMMGSPESEPQRWDGEGPQHKITIGKPFAVGRHAVTRGQFSAFVNDTSHNTENGATVWTGKELKLDPYRSWRNPGFLQDDSHPVVCVNWNDARAYSAWLSETTGQTYRFLTEAEWEYVARAGTTTPFWWGPSITATQANYNGKYTYPAGRSKGEYREATVPVASFEVNPWGLFNVHGNVWEWCEDIMHSDYNGAPVDGFAWARGGDSSRRVVRGGSWNSNPEYLRSAHRDGHAAGIRISLFGFRVGRTLTA